MNNHCAQRHLIKSTENEIRRHTLEGMMKFRIGCLLTIITLLVLSDQNAEAQSKPKTRSKNSVAVFHLKGPITEKPMADDFPFSLGSAAGESLKDLITRMKKAGDDDSRSPSLPP